MTSLRRARPSEVADYESGLNYFLEQGWTDGNPILLPTERKVSEYLQILARDPLEVVAHSKDRNRTITIEHVVVNSIMAGCLPEELPVVIAAMQAVLGDGYQHNHLASLGGPWPFFIVSGPVVSELGLNYDQYVMGPGGRVNSVISRATSLIAWNCLDQRPGGVQRGSYGPAWRNESILPERPDSPWMQLNEERGFAKEVSTVTAYPATATENVMIHLIDTPLHILAPIVDSLSTGRFMWGPFVIVLPPNMVAIFTEAGWTKQDIKDYIVENTKRSIAELKVRTRWAEQQAGRRPWSELLDVKEGDRETMIYMFKRPSAEYYDISFRDKFLDGRDSEVIVIDSGGDSGPTTFVLIPGHESAPIPITVPITPLGQQPTPHLKSNS